VKRPEELVAIRHDLLRVARDTRLPDGVGPQRHVYAEHGRVGTAYVRAAIGGWRYPEHANQQPEMTWDEAIRAYGLTPHSETRTVSDKELIEDLRRVGHLNGQGPDGLPPVEVYKQHGRWSWMTVLRRFGGQPMSWYRVGEYARLQPVARAKRGSITRTRLIADYRGLADLQGVEHGEMGPTRRQFDHWVSYSASSASYHFGSWSAFVKAATCPRQDQNSGAGGRERNSTRSPSLGS